MIGTTVCAGRESFVVLQLVPTRARSSSLNPLASPLPWDPCPPAQVQQQLNNDLSGSRVVGFNEKALAAAVIGEDARLEVLPWSPDMEWWPWQETPVRHGVPPPNYSS
jgi:hypothetical protein